MSATRRAGRATQPAGPLEDPLSSAVAHISSLRAAPGATDYGPPPLRSGFVPRERLLRRLLTSFQVPLVLLVAPAGYGKTTVLAQWADRDPRPFAWLEIEEADNDPGRLLGSIARALHHLEPIGPDVFGALTVAHTFSAAALARLRRYIKSRDRDFVLVLDDLHRLHAEESLEIVGAIAEDLRAGSQLALGSRSDPPLLLGRLRAHRNLLELRSRDLAMTEAEGAPLLAETGLTLGSPEVSTLMDRTEGWPAGLYLAALALRDAADLRRAVARFAGDDRVVIDYLRDELLSRLADEQVSFLTRTSVLDRLSGDLCDAVLERSGSAGVLREMSRANLLLIPLDRHDEWYRCHTLLNRALRSELRHREPEREAGLHRRASGWFEAHDDPDRAIDHALAAEDARRAGDMMWANVPRYVAGGRMLTMQRWIERLPSSEIGAYAPLALTAAHCQTNCSRICT